MKFSAVILAGGKSSRMGRDKARLEIDGESLLGRQIQLVRNAGAHEVLISGRAGADYSEFGCRVLQDRFVGSGPMGGIERALAETTSSLVLVLAVDMPRMTSGFLSELLLRCEHGLGVVPRVKNVIEPLVAVYPQAALRLVEDLLSVRRENEPDGDVVPAREKSPGATAFARECAERGLVRLVELPASEARLFENWNSPMDVK